MSCAVRMMIALSYCDVKVFSDHYRQDQIVQIPILLALLLSKRGTPPYLHILLVE